tara:strand:- start:1 stop:261 length:261 start_codon:yes stop_codon:yes gene_type:complete
MNITFTEIGIISIGGLFFAFVLKIHRQTLESRCSEINCFCIKCKRDILNGDDIVKLRQLEPKEPTLPSASAPASSPPKKTNVASKV